MGKRQSARRWVLALLGVVLVAVVRNIFRALAKSAGGAARQALKGTVTTKAKDAGNWFKRQFRRK